jgi:hypothetical protein
LGVDILVVGLLGDHRKQGYLSCCSGVPQLKKGFSRDTHKTHYY